MKKNILSTICIILSIAMISCGNGTADDSTGADSAVNESVYPHSDMTLATPSEIIATYEGINVPVYALRYFFVNAYRDFYETNYADILSYFDPNVPLHDQVPTKEEYKDHPTWYDYFLSIAKRDLEYYLAFAAEATKNDISLTDAEKASVDQSVDSLVSTAEGYGLSFQEYMEDFEGMGPGITAQTVKDTYYILQLATKYLQHKYDTFEMTDDDIQKEYEENKNVYSVVDYNIITITPEYDATSSPEEIEDAKKDAVSKADAFIASLESGASFTESYKVSYPDAEEKDITEFEKKCTVKNAGYSTEKDDVLSWLFDDSRADGDIKKFEDSQGRIKIVQVVKAPHPNDFPVVNLRYIYIDLSLGEYTESTAKKIAEDIIDQVSKSNNKDELFNELVEKHSDDTVTNKTGGLAENIIPTTTSLPENVVSWAFEDGRNLYDCGYQEYSNYGVVCGYFVTFVSSHGEPYHEYIIKSNLRTEMLSDYIKSLTESVSVDYNAEMAAAIYK